jgi:hypothetical protein
MIAPMLGSALPDFVFKNAIERNNGGFSITGIHHSIETTKENEEVRTC